MAESETTSPAQSDDNALVVKIVNSYRQESVGAKKGRLALNRRNWNLYYGNVDWSHKIDGQSAEHLPKIGVAAEQMSAFIRRSLVQFGDFFSVDVPQDSPLSAEQIRALMRKYLERVCLGRGQYEHISAIIGDGVKQGLMESMIVLKVHGAVEPYREMYAEGGDTILGIPDELKSRDHKLWRLRVDVVPTNDYDKDPTGAGLYEIHRVERDLTDVWDMVEAGLYDKAAVEKLTEHTERMDAEAKRASDRNQDESTVPIYRKRVVLDEMWGTLLGTDGRPLNGQTNIVCTVANGTHIIREPEANPFWHQESPFVARTIIRSPDSVWSKAVYDDAGALNVALDEMFNLILDGGLAAVWGVRQVRTAMLADPRQVSDGIPQGATLALADDAPVDMKVVENVTTGAVPQDSLNVLNLVDREYNSSALTNDFRLGYLPPRAVKATEVLAADQSTNALTDTIAGDIETGVITPMLRKAWLLILQNADDLSSSEVVDAIGVQAAFRLSRMSKPQRYAMFANGFRFKVSGLSETLSKSRDFQKSMALLQGIATIPMMLESFLRRFSPDKMLDALMKSLNINPESLGLSPNEAEELPDRMAAMQQLTPMLAPNQGSAPKEPGSGPMDAARSDMSSSTTNSGGYQ